VASELALYERLTVLLLDPATPYEPKRIFSMCAPKHPKNERFIDGNHRLAQKRWDAAFGKPLDLAIDRLRRVPPSPRSPIVEALKGVTWMEDFGPDVAQRRLVTFSDLLQNSEGLSHYRGRPDYALWRGTEHAARHRLAMAGVSVVIHYLERPETLRLQTETHRRFWSDFFREAGAKCVFADGFVIEPPEPSPKTQHQIVRRERGVSPMPVPRTDGHRQN